ncbi:Proheparin-binding EGF-like growth factor [Bagarius yarrelli]|uniref:Proheparin-binding EGF-like growth factor n=1 Tax=Bagarius yarrelli TaxID=175774 RepID=A0A556U918_BAGYA|nr:Proheparin-binding EGF-like growth factor [Bagarius yarrelli]
MKLCVLAVLVHVLVILTLTSGASIDRYESEKPSHTTVIHLLRTSEALNDKRLTENTKPEDHRLEEEEEYYYDDDEQYEYDLSGDFEMPQVAFSSKPKDPSAVLNAERREAEGNERKAKGERKGKGKGKGKKRNPCLKKYKDYCIHGTCQYLRKIGPSCICNPGYSGERCLYFSLPVGTHEEGYSRTTALAVVAVVLSSLCLTIIGLLLALRFHKRGTYDVENEEKGDCEVREILPQNKIDKMKAKKERQKRTARKKTEREREKRYGLGLVSMFSTRSLVLGPVELQCDEEEKKKGLKQQGMFWMQKHFLPTVGSDTD